MIEPWWTQVNSRRLAQGDLLTDCLLPVFTGTEPVGGERAIEEDVERARLIVMTQSCDLENDRAPYVALCTIHRLDEFERANVSFAKRGAWESVRKGRVEGLHLLAAPERPDDNREALVVDFAHIVSLPIGYLCDYAESLEHRWRLKSPFLEHFSQAFARHFMRVGLPSGIAPFR
jgi:hypothetical protein